MANTASAQWLAHVRHLLDVLGRLPQLRGDALVAIDDLLPGDGGPGDRVAPKLIDALSC